MCDPMECPACHTSLDGGDILEELTKLRDAGTYYEGYSDIQLRRAASNYGWYNDVEEFKAFDPWRRNDPLPPQRLLRFSHAIGVVERDTFDHWRCPKCGHEWGHHEFS
jgi:hypothetical protein